METKEKPVCCNCEEELTEDREEYYNLCEDCYNDEYVLCEGCGNETANDDARITDNGNSYCEDCYTDKYRKCESCEKELDLNDVMTDESGNDYCDDCYNDTYARCAECECEVLNDNTYYNENDDNYYCQPCHDEKQDVNGLHAYTFKPVPIFFGKDDKLFLGVELEVEADTDLIEKLEKPELYFKKDGSLNAGFEVVSHPATLAYHKGFWTDTLNTLKDKGAKSFQTKTCGVHVHVNKDFFTETEKIKLGLFVYGQKRNVERIARRSASKWSVFKDKKISEITFSSERYEALNWQNRHTIEFRVFKGNLKPESFFSYLEFVHAACNFVKTENSITIANASKAWQLFNQYLAVNKTKYVNLINFLKENN